MKKIFIIIFVWLFVFTMLGCDFSNGNLNNNPHYMDIEKLYEENRKAIDAMFSLYDFEILSTKYEDKNFRYEFRIKSRGYPILYDKFEKIGNIRINYNKVMYIDLSYATLLLMYEMESEEAAKEIAKKLEPVINRDVWYSENIIYFNEQYYNLITGNYKKHKNDYITLDGKVLLAHVSTNTVVYTTGVNEIGYCSFYMNTYVHRIYTNESLKIIKMSAFADCFNLFNIYLNEGLIEISRNAFAGCKSLNHVIIPESVKKIGKYAFNNCVSLKYVVIPEGVEEIGEYTFTNGIIFCESLGKPKGWNDNFASNQAIVVWGHGWEYDANGVPVVKEEKTNY